MPLLERKKPEADLRRSYKINIQIGLIAALLIMIAFFRFNLDLGADMNFEEEEQELVDMEDIVQTEQVETPPPPPRPQTPEEVPDDEIIDDQEFDLDAELDQGASDLPPPPPPADDEEEEQEIFEVVEHEPEPIGGMNAIYDNLEYPEIARRAGIEGVVVIQFVVDVNGRVSELSVLRDIGGGAGDAAMEAIRDTEWTPGRQRGRPVPVRFQVPIRFQLQN